MDLRGGPLKGRTSSLSTTTIYIHTFLHSLYHYMLLSRPLRSSLRKRPNKTTQIRLARTYTMAPTKRPFHSPSPHYQTPLTNLPLLVPSDPRPIVISGPSGVGKGTLYKLLMDRHPSTFATTISNTTREPRPGETRDVDYYYISMAEFEQLIASGAFVEHAKFGGNRYGTSKRTIEELEKGGKVVVLDIEMEVRFWFYFCYSRSELSGRG